MPNIKEIRAFLALVVVQYLPSAPTVSDWANDLYIRLAEKMDEVRLVEIVTAQMLLEEGQWLHPNFAANRIYHLMNRLGQDTTGHIGY